MEGSVIGLINLIGSGEVGYGDWREHPARFANLIQQYCSPLIDIIIHKSQIFTY